VQTTNNPKTNVKNTPNGLLELFCLKYMKGIMANAIPVI
jgi:hypothetical protein